VRLRDRHPHTGEAFLITGPSRRLTHSAFYDTFPKLRRQAGLEERGERGRARAHDLRHSFAVRTLIDWHQAGENIDAKLPLLSTYLGHYAGDPVKSEAGLVVFWLAAAVDRVPIEVALDRASGAEGRASATRRATCRSGRRCRGPGERDSVGWRSLRVPKRSASRPGARPVRNLAGVRARVWRARRPAGSALSSSALRGAARSASVRRRGRTARAA